MSAANQKLLAEKNLTALRDLRKTTLLRMQQLERELAGIQGNIRSVSLAVDVAAAVATPVAIGAKRIFQTGMAFEKGAISAAQAYQQTATNVVGRTWGVGMTPVGSGVIQGGAQIIASDAGWLTPKAKDGMVVAFGKIITQSFFDMWSPSYWAKRLAGDPNIACQQALKQIRKTKLESLREIDKRISKWQQIRDFSGQGIDIRTLA